MKNVYIAKYRHGISGKALVAGDNLEDAKREALAYARFAAMCIPADFEVDDVVESVEPAGDVPLGAAGYGCRRVSQTDTGPYQPPKFPAPEYAWRTSPQPAEPEPTPAV